MSEQPQRPTNDDRVRWKAYWAAQGMPWRTEPEIDEERQRELDRRRHKIEPNIEQGIYPFKDIEPKLTRADVEWLLATHESGGMRGPVDWQDELQREREGVDLRGADLHRKNLSGLPLARVRAGLSSDEWPHATPWQVDEAAAHLEGADLSGPRGGRYDWRTHLEGARLTGVHLEGCSLYRARLEHSNLDKAYLYGATLDRAHMEHITAADAKFSGASARQAHFEAANLTRANMGGYELGGSELLAIRQRLPDFPDTLPAARLQEAFFDAGTYLASMVLGTSRQGAAAVADVRWDGVNLAVIDWKTVQRGVFQTRIKAIELGEERDAFKATDQDGAPKGKGRRRVEFEAAVRANRQLATALRVQGLNADANLFSYNAQALERHVLWREGRRGSALGSWFLDLISGYGYRPWRSFITYVLVILAFAAAYFILGEANGQTLSWNEAIVISMTAFHGRGFFSTVFQPGDLQAAVAAVEAFIGLMIEIVFIATFTQRFFAH